MARKFRFTQDGLKQKVELDGEDISSAIRSMSFDVDAWQLPTVRLDLAVFEVEADMSETKIHITESTVDLLKRLGWTPPAEEA